MLWRRRTASVSVSKIYDDLRLFTLSDGEMAYIPCSYGSLGTNGFKYNRAGVITPSIRPAFPDAPEPVVHPFVRPRRRWLWRV